MYLIMSRVINPIFLSQTGPIFGVVLACLVSLASCSLLSVLAYLALGLLCAVVGVRVYTIVMIKAGKMEAGSDLLACVAAVSLELPEAVVADHSACLAGALNCALGRARALFLLENPVRRISQADHPF
jgi:hypothetical protein